jgi:hypothetical protein
VGAHGGALWGQDKVPEKAVGVDGASVGQKTPGFQTEPGAHVTGRTSQPTLSVSG